MSSGCRRSSRGVGTSAGAAATAVPVATAVVPPASRASMASRPRPSASTFGTSRLIQRGIHHAARPSRVSAAGMITMRTTRASARTPTVRAMPMDPMIWSPLVANPTNTPDMMSAAATTTGAERRNPASTASFGLRPWACCSWIAETRNIW